jgi:hypothetical protein
MGNEDYRSKCLREVDKRLAMQSRLTDCERELEFARDDNTLLKAKTSKLSKQLKAD